MTVLATAGVVAPIWTLALMVSVRPEPMVIWLAVAELVLTIIAPPKVASAVSTRLPGVVLAAVAPKSRVFVAAASV